MAKVQSALPAARPLIPCPNCERADYARTQYLTQHPETGLDHFEEAGIRDGVRIFRGSDYMAQWALNSVRVADNSRVGGEKRVSRD